MFFLSSFSMENGSLSEGTRDLYIKNAQSIQRGAFRSSYVNPANFNDVKLSDFYFKLFYFDIFELDTVNEVDLFMQITFCKNGLPIIKILKSLFGDSVEIQEDNLHFKKLFSYVYLKVFSKLDFGKIQQAKLGFEKARYEFFYNLFHNKNDQPKEEKIVIKEDRKIDKKNLDELNRFFNFLSTYIELEVSSSYDVFLRKKDLIEDNANFSLIEEVQFSIKVPKEINSLFITNCGKNPFLFKYLIVSLFENKKVEELVLSMNDLEKKKLIEEDKKHLDFEYYRNIKDEKTDFAQEITVDNYLKNIFLLDEKKKLVLKSKVTEILKEGFINIINSCCETLLIDSESEITKKFLVSNLCNNFFDQQIRAFPLFVLGQTFTKEYSEYGKNYLPFHQALEEFLKLYIQYLEFYECIDEQEKYKQKSNRLIDELSKLDFSETLHDQIKEFYSNQFDVFLKEDMQELSLKNNLEDLWKKSIKIFLGDKPTEFIEKKSVNLEELINASLQLKKKKEVQTKTGSVIVLSKLLPKKRVAVILMFFMIVQW